ncbi:MAG: hypothetical protein H7333_06860, partial [Bdellovibrionales bacterium]|nr:hypothetical protein [Oligoflexia bacterium]
LSLEDLEHGLEQYPKLDLYLYSGELDTFSPREGCTEVVSRLGARAHYTNFLNSGHDWLYEKQIWNDFKKE